MQVHLIRHGEVHNPEHVVYADIPGFVLSERGMAQARATAEYLSRFQLAAIVSSPLDRAVQTAFAVAEKSAAKVSTDDRLTEWKLGQRWAGVRWDDLPERFPGELEQYLDDPTDLAFSSESLETMAQRIAGAVCDWAQSIAPKDVAFVSHQDPIHGGTKVLTAAGLGGYHDAKPEHCSVTTLTSQGGLWRRSAYWAPEQ